MFDKMAVSMLTAYYKAKAKFMSLTSEEDGMETIEAVILIAIAVIIAGVLVEFLTKGQFEGVEGGLVGYIFHQIGEKIKALFE